MRIKAKISFSGVAFSVALGETAELPEDIAKDLIRAGYAEEVTDEDKRDNKGDDTKSAPRRRSSSKQ